MYDAMFEAYKRFILENSKYEPKVVKIYNPSSIHFPITTFPKPRTKNINNTQKNVDKSKNNYFTIEHYAKDKNNISAQVIIDELGELTTEFFEKLNIEIELDDNIPNIDTNILRRVQQGSFNIDNRGIITRI